MDPGDGPYVCFQWLTPKQAMDLENWNPQKKILKAPDFATLKHLILIILWYQSSISSSQAELLTILWVRRCFEKNRAVKDFDIKQKNQFEKK